MSNTELFGPQIAQITRIIRARVLDIGLIFWVGVVALQYWYPKKSA